MGDTDVCDHCHIDLGDLGNDGQFSRLTHPQFNHTDLVLTADLCHGDRHTDLAIMVAWCLKYPEAAA